MMPVFTHRKGQLWLAEKVALDLLHKGDIYADLMATMNFKNKVDACDDRPMTYPFCGSSSPHSWISYHPCGKGPH